MKINDELIVEIEKLSNLGFGIARVDGFVIFVEAACPQDKLKIKLTKVNKNYANGEIIEIIEPSAHRVRPFCAMHKVCGGCQLQFIDYDYQLELKKQIVQDEMRDLCEVQDVIRSPQDRQYRHKVQYPISQTKDSKRILAGYFKPKSHELVNIKHCPIQPEICDEIIEFIRDSAYDFGITGYRENKHVGDLRHVALRVSAATGKVLVVLVINATKNFEKLKDFAQSIYDHFKVVTGVCVNFNSKKTNVIMGESTELLVGKQLIKERILDKTFKIGASTFFQVNPKSAENIFGFVKDYVAKNFERPTILDAYAGVGAFGITLCDIAKKVVCFEENKQAVGLSDEMIKLNEIKNVELHCLEAKKFFENETRLKKRKFDIIILDPPRKGCSQESLEHCFNLGKQKIIYVSCNPSTLARDLRILVEKGATVELIQPFDMFAHTYHVETVAIVNLPS